MTTRNLLLLGLSSIALQGCIAAAAIPIVAGGGALVRDTVSDDARLDQREGVAVVPLRVPTPPPPPTPAPTAAVAATTAVAEPPAREPDTDSAVSDAWALARETAASLAPARPAPAQAERAALAASATTAPERSEEPETGALAASASSAASAAEPPAPAVTSSAQAGADLRGYGSLRNYALRTLSEGVPLPSAMLADPTSLQPVRRDCEGNAPTVVIDLDPQGELVPIVGPLQVNTELARILADLRLRDVQIAWITDRGPIDARAIRDRLVASGLDPDAEDSLYVERYPGETKQARRAALAQTQCVIALAGDERSDFDDLYNFIREPGDARNLELLLGHGWFLIDNPVGG